MLTFTTNRQSTIFSLNQLIDRIIETFQLEYQGPNAREKSRATQGLYLFLESMELFQGVLIRCLHFIARTLIT